MQELSPKPTVRPLTYWAIAIHHPHPTKPGYSRLDTGFLYIFDNHFEPHWEEVEKTKLEQGEELLDFINISQEVYEAQPRIFVDRNGWVDVDFSALKVGGQASA